MFNNLLEKVWEADNISKLIESKIKDLHFQFVDSGKVPEETFNMFVKADPSREKYKYLQWMLKQYLFNPERSQHIIDVTVLFDDQVKKGKISGEESDIYRYTLEEADKLASEKSELKTHGEEEREIKAEESERIKETDRYLIVRPKTHKASCFYGANTKWCTSAKTSDYWYKYWKEGNNIYIVIDKKKDKKYAVVVSFFGRKTVYDEKDEVISFDDLKRKLGE